MSNGDGTKSACELANSRHSNGAQGARIDPIYQAYVGKRNKGATRFGNCLHKLYERKLSSGQQPTRSLSTQQKSY